MITQKEQFKTGHIICNIWVALLTALMSRWERVSSAIPVTIWLVWVFYKFPILIISDPLHLESTFFQVEPLKCTVNEDWDDDTNNKVLVTLQSIIDLLPMRRLVDWFPSSFT